MPCGLFQSLLQLLELLWPPLVRQTHVEPVVAFDILQVGPW